VDIYYESQCPNCHNILKNYLPGVMSSLGEYVNVRFFPFGMAQVMQNPATGDLTFACQHGEEECWGNMIQACAADLYEPSTHIPFVTCMSKGGLDINIEEAADTCAQHHDVDMTRIAECVRSGHGPELMAYIAKTSVGKIHYVPWVEVNGDHWEIDEDIKDHVCEKLLTPPHACFGDVEHYVEDPNRGKRCIKC